MDYGISRRKMVERLLVARGIGDRRILDAFMAVPRHLFVEEGLQPKAYGDHSLPIGEKQTISQPWVVARMLELAGIESQDRVLEIGGGTGYQTALLGHLAGQVYSIERHASLARRAQATIKSLGLLNVHVKAFDGTYGWSEWAPYQAIIVSAGSQEVPPPLLSQLADGGRLVIPIGPGEHQRLNRVEKRGDVCRTTVHEEVTFVRLVGRFGWSE